MHWFSQDKEIHEDGDILVMWLVWNSWMAISKVVKSNFYLAFKHAGIYLASSFVLLLSHTENPKKEKLNLKETPPSSLLYNSKYLPFLCQLCSCLEVVKAIMGIFMLGILQFKCQNDLFSCTKTTLLDLARFHLMATSSIINPKLWHGINFWSQNLFWTLFWGLTSHNLMIILHFEKH